MPAAPLPDRFGGWFWQAPAYLDYVHAPLTDAAVAAAEAQLGVRLPALYLVLLRQQNGGYLRGGWPGTVSHSLFGIGDGFPSITGQGAWWKQPDPDPGLFVPDQPALLVPFDGDGHWDMCFDYRRSGPQAEPAVTHVDLDARSDEVVADSFRDYLAGLTDEDADTELRLSTDLPLDQVAAQLAARLDRAVDDQGDASHGYRVLRIALPGAYQWCWLGPNRVPRGFRRQGRRVIATPDTTLRRPEDPTCTILVSATDASRDLVTQALADCGLR